jgi:predicted Ser/Thr protein kinase
VRAGRERKKKLTVAFHFQFSNRAGWNCESCRRNGLETKRRCGFLPEEKRGEPRIVWGRKQTQSEECPKSFVTGESLALVEEFFVRRRLGIEDSIELEARKVDAFLILRDEMEREERDGKTQH